MAVREALKAIIDNNELLASRIPEDARTDLAQIASAVLSDFDMRNAWVNELVNRIGLVLIHNRLYENPLAEFKKGSLEYGTAIEEIFVGIAQSYKYGITEDASDKEYGLYNPDISAMFHKLNFQQMYPVTVSEVELRRALLSERNVQELVDKIVASVYTGANYDEQLCMLNLFNLGGNDNYMYNVHVDALTTEATGKAFAKSARAMSRQLTFMNTAYNKAGVPTYSNMDDVIIFVTPEVEASLDVDVLAYAFHIDNVEMRSRIKVVPDFGGLANTVAIMADKRFLMVYDVVREMTPGVYVQSELRWNYFYHVWEIFSISGFANVIRFTTDAVGADAVSAVTVSPDTVTLPQGATLKLVADVTATGNANRGVTWTSSAPAVVTVDNGGVIRVVGDEGSATITATSVFDSTRTDTATVTVAE